MDIAKTPDFRELQDFPTLKKLAATLWNQDSTFLGAAVMVGAGFSRSSATSGDARRRIPLWLELSTVLAHDLGYVGTATPGDPMRIAEEYAAYFGKQALSEQIKKNINDRAWQPGIDHQQLLSLPWTEVLTTNWDTLLERSAQEDSQRLYSLVSKPEDLASARAPRIVKLHGTVNTSEDLIFTQEDYRQYPKKYAAFVNFARQVFIENELCLIGFSGDDPNFLHWAGWVRDSLANSTRRIYLVGALNLSAPKRKYLESINIAPIDLYELVKSHDDGDQRHKEATKIFLGAMQELEPKTEWDWRPKKIDASQNIDEKLLAMREDRESYPGWLVCPSIHRSNLLGQCNDFQAVQMELDEQTLYELAWRRNITFSGINTWLVNRLLPICDPSVPNSLTQKQQMEVSLWLLKNTSIIPNIDIEQKTTEILNKYSKFWPESDNELVYHQALSARDQLNYPQLELLIEKLEENEPVWMLRKASLLSDLSRFDEGGELINKAYRELLKQHRRDPNSIFILSRLAIADWLNTGIRWKMREKYVSEKYSPYQCDSWSHIQSLKEQISKQSQKQQDQQDQQGIELRFEPGQYKKNSDLVSFNNDIHPMLLWEGITSSLGTPIRWEMVNFIADTAAKVADLPSPHNRNQLTLALRSAKTDTSKQIQTVFSRVKVARLSQSDADWLRKCCINAIDYWRNKQTRGTNSQQKDAINHLRICIEVLARVSIRSTSDNAKKLFKLAMDIGQDHACQHVWLFDALDHLIKYSLKSIPEQDQGNLLLEALNFPLISETKVDPDWHWPNPVISHPDVRQPNKALDHRIEQLIKQATPESSDRTYALSRLIPLVEKGFLHGSEEKHLAGNLWDSIPNYDSLPPSELFAHALLKLPSPDRERSTNVVRRHLFEAKAPDLLNPTRLMHITYAATTADRSEMPTSNQAVNYFSILTAWRPKIRNDGPLDFEFSSDNAIGKWIGNALAFSIVPALPKSSLNSENFAKLFQFIENVDAPAALIGMPFFHSATNSDSIQTPIRRGLLDSSPQETTNAAEALLKWRELDNNPKIDNLVTLLITRLGVHQMSGLSEQISVIERLLKKNLLAESEIETLTETVPILFDSTCYAGVSDDNENTASISLVRAACAKLAKELMIELDDDHLDLFRVIEEASCDPLPEVRLAVNSA